MPEMMFGHVTFADGNVQVDPGRTASRRRQRTQKPKVISSRVSILPTSRPTTIRAMIAPIPRGLMAMPLFERRIAHQPWRNSGNSAVVL